MMPLGLLGAGEHAEIVEIRTVKSVCPNSCNDEREKCDCRVEDMGLRIGKRVEMLSNGSGPVLLKVDESRIALARALAMKIIVKEVKR